jgi:hypothetical protein
MTVDLTTTKTKIVFWAIVALCGALGGLAAELVKARKIGPRSEEGAIELSKRLTPRLLDLGTPASLIVGAVAAAVAVWIFSMVDTVSRGTGASAQIVDQYNVVRLVGVALIAGFSGPKFLQTAAERTLALIDEQHMETALRSTLAASTAQRKAAAAPGAAGGAATGAAVEQHAEVVEAIAKEGLSPGSVTRLRESNA